MSPPPLSEQFVQLAELSDGWAGPASKGLDRKILEGFEHLLTTVVQDLNLPLPTIYPWPQGGLRAEWSVGSLEISIDADYPEFLLYMHSADLSKTGYLEEECPMDPCDEARNRVSAFLKPLFEGTQES